MVSSPAIQGVVARVAQGKNLLSTFRQDPSRLLQPAAGKLGSRLNWFEALAVAAVVVLLAFFALFGVWRFGFTAMLTSGVTPLLAYLIGLVLSMVVFRGLLDRLLRPVYGLLGKLAVPTRLTLGLLAPAAWCLWDSKDWGSGFYHAGQTITIATLLGHILLRSTEHQVPPPSPKVQQAVMLMGFVLLLRHLALADDCSSPEDAMDTWYVGPPVKGLVSTVIAVSVNGKTILTKWLKPATPPDKDSQPPFYRLNASSQDRRTDLVLDGSEGLWVYAWISVTNPPPGYDAAAATEAIGFSAPDCLQLSEPQLAGSRKAVHVRAITPASGEAPSSATLICSATLSGQPVVAPMPFALQGGYEMVVTTSSEWS